MTLLVGDVTEGDGDEDDDNHAHADAHVDYLVVDAAVGLSWGGEERRRKKQNDLSVRLLQRGADAKKSTVDWLAKEKSRETVDKELKEQ